MVTLTDVSVAFGGNTVLSHLTLALPESGVVAVTGPSGSGKTTLLRVLAGLQRPTEGSVGGLPARVSYVFQEDRLLPWLTAFENIALVTEDAARARALTAAVELADAAGKRPSELSGGMRRRVAIARALAYSGDMLLLDEPFTGLDGALRARMAALIRGAFPLTVISTHDEADAVLIGGASAEIRLG